MKQTNPLTQGYSGSKPPQSKPEVDTPQPSTSQISIDSDSSILPKTTLAEPTVTPDEEYVDIIDW